MKKISFKLLLTAIMVIGIISCVQFSVFAANENIEILKENDTDYLIYLKNNLDSKFTFAFSSSKDESGLLYKKSQLDSTDANAKNIAYVNSSLVSLFVNNKAYMWVKDSNGNLIISALEIDLSDSITKAELETANKITKIINVDTKATSTTTEDVDGKKVSVTTGKVVIKDEGNFKYQLIKVSNSDEYKKLMDLAQRIQKFNDNTDIYTQIDVYKEFYRLYETLMPKKDDSKWLDVSNMEVLQPEDAENGDQYILWLKDSKGTTDAQFLTSLKEYSEEKIKELVTTKLPVTYDNNILLIVLGILIFAIMVVSFRIKSLKKQVK